MNWVTLKRIWNIGNSPGEKAGGLIAVVPIVIMVIVSGFLWRDPNRAMNFFINPLSLTLVGSFIGAAIGGFAAGFVMRYRGWKYGLSTGLSASFFPWFLLFIPREGFSSELIVDKKIFLVAVILMNILVGTIGGWLGSKLWEGRR